MTRRFYYTEYWTEERLNARFLELYYTPTAVASACIDRDHELNIIFDTLGPIKVDNLIDNIPWYTKLSHWLYIHKL